MKYIILFALVTVLMEKMSAGWLSGSKQLGIGLCVVCTIYSTSLK